MPPLEDYVARLLISVDGPLRVRIRQSPEGKALRGGSRIAYNLYTTPCANHYFRGGCAHEQPNGSCYVSALKSFSIAVNSQNGCALTETRKPRGPNPVWQSIQRICQAVTSCRIRNLTSVFSAKEDLRGPRDIAQTPEESAERQRDHERDHRDTPGYIHTRRTPGSSQGGVCDPVV